MATQADDWGNQPSGGEEAGDRHVSIIGVLAIQGSYREHCAALRRCGVQAIEVRKAEQLTRVSGLIIPGGESTTMANVAERNGLIAALRGFAQSGKPMWGTCAGLIFLANRATGQKKGGQALLGGLDCKVHRNFFGSQINSFETELPVPSHFPAKSPDHFRAIFIRAPGILEVGEGVEVLAECPVPEGMVVPTAEVDEGMMVIPTAVDVDKDKIHAPREPTTAPSCGDNHSRDKVIVAIRQGHLLGTAFHPELTSDLRWHLLFLDMVRCSNPKTIPMEEVEEEGALAAGGGGGEEGGKKADSARAATTTTASFTFPSMCRPEDLPIFREERNMEFELI
ncbi:hypothetical protein CBR_g31179 [Chara braunii]|uniref:glutaminase n=1 Tax=Chara braunii TaxID=69332 RepID=A0A388JXL2_CHABU|nr:hypothetical protein CBR_g31179 [Chara braunii]|eukprot:GBG62540.1 hypothetical protein CBR_g31179 [Chara braunii]